MKIPTLLGLTLLIIAIGLGLFLYWYYQKTERELKLALEPYNISIANITDSETSVIWQTNLETKGGVIWSSGDSLNFATSEKKEDKGGINHFLTLDNLQPGKEYYVAVKNDKYTYSENGLKFKTALNLKGPALTYNPIIGSIVSETLQPIEDALVIFKTSGASNLATLTKKGGIFILPLKELRQKDLSTFLSLREDGIGELDILLGDKKSNIKIALPSSNKPLPPVILGQNYDFITAQKEVGRIPEDINKDGVVNSLDLAIVRNNLGRQPKERNVDLNMDGIVDQKDIELIKLKLVE